MLDKTELDTEPSTTSPVGGSSALGYITTAVPYSVITLTVVPIYLSEMGLTVNFLITQLSGRIRRKI